MSDFSVCAYVNILVKAAILLLSIICTLAYFNTFRYIYLATQTKLTFKVNTIGNYERKTGKRNVSEEFWTDSTTPKTA